MKNHNPTDYAPQGSPSKPSPLMDKISDYAPASIPPHVAPVSKSLPEGPEEVSSLPPASPEGGEGATTPASTQDGSAEDDYED